MKRLILTCVVAFLVVAVAQPAQAQYYYVDADYLTPLVIKLDGDPADGQEFDVSGSIIITCELHSYAAMCAGWGNEAYTDAELEVSGPSGPGSDTAGDYDFDDYECAEVETIKTLTIAYPLTTPGVHTVYMRSYAEAASWYAELDEEDLEEALLTFTVLVPTIPVVIDIKPGSDPNPINLGSNGLIPVAILSSVPFDATTVDPATVFLGGVGVAVRGKGSKLMSHVKDVNGDGLDDLLVQVETDGFGDPGEGGIVLLTGETFDGIPIEGSDVVVIVPAVDE